MFSLLAHGDTALKSYFLLRFGAHKKGCDNDTFRAIFPSIWVSWDPQTLQNKGKHKMTNRPCFTPPPERDCSTSKLKLPPPHCRPLKHSMTFGLPLWGYFGRLLSRLLLVTFALWLYCGGRFASPDGVKRRER